MRVIWWAILFVFGIIPAVFALRVGWDAFQHSRGCPRGPVLSADSEGRLLLSGDVVDEDELDALLRTVSEAPAACVTLSLGEKSLFGPANRLMNAADVYGVRVAIDLQYEAE